MAALASGRKPADPIMDACSMPVEASATTTPRPRLPVTVLPASRALVVAELRNIPTLLFVAVLPESRQ